jgi:UDP:flavonoid glycosyltransferase YjiC (YdhE family)
LTAGHGRHRASFQLRRRAPRPGRPLSRGHAQPLLDLASLLAARGVLLTVASTPVTAPLLAAHPASVRPLTFPSAADHDTSSGADVHALDAALGA